MSVPIFVCYNFCSPYSYARAIASILSKILCSYDSIHNTVARNRLNPTQAIYFYAVHCLQIGYSTLEIAQKTWKLTVAPSLFLLRVVFLRWINRHLEALEPSRVSHSIICPAATRNLLNMLISHQLSYLR